MIRAPQLFLNEWASGYASRLKPKLKKLRFAIDDLDKFRKNWNPGLRLSAWGGEVGATYFTKHLKPEDCTVYMDLNDPHVLRDMVQQFRLRADPEGRIEVVEMFWNSDYFVDSFPTVSPHLIYADLIATQADRFGSGRACTQYEPIDPSIQSRWRSWRRYKRAPNDSDTVIFSSAQAHGMC
jgi:hypothetical protein